jgi:hypothetical protein
VCELRANATCREVFLLMLLWCVLDADTLHLIRYALFIVSIVMQMHVAVAVG